MIDEAKQVAADVRSEGLTLLTDLYQLTMAQGYFEEGKHNDLACFYMFFRDMPFEGGYAVAAGIDQLMDLVEGFHFDQDDIDYLAGLPAPGGGLLFKQPFLDYLRELVLTVDIDTVREGDVAPCPCGVHQSDRVLWRIFSLQGHSFHELYSEI